MTTPRMTVIVPVFNRQSELRRLLTSMTMQSFADFECLVVDDSSTIPIEPLVTELGDSRFRYLRNARNGGPYNARTVGYRHMRGDYLMQFDSDWEAYPWALAQSVRYLDDYPQVDAVSGMHLRHQDSAMFVRVRDGKRIIAPEDYVSGRPVPDCVGAVRRCVVEEWLTKRQDYFAMEFHQWFTFGMHHRHLYVDEPWVRYHTDGGDRVSTGHDGRRLDDYMKFIEEHDEYLRSVNAPFLSEMLFGMWLDLLRAGRTADRKRMAEYLRLRRVPIARKLASKIAAKLASKAAAMTSVKLRSIHAVFSI